MGRVSHDPSSLQVGGETDVLFVLATGFLEGAGAARVMLAIVATEELNVAMQLRERVRRQFLFQKRSLLGFENNRLEAELAAAGALSLW